MHALSSVFAGGSLLESLHHFCLWLNDTGPATALRESLWAFPVVETIHVLAITLLAGSIAILDLRLLGVLLRGARVTVVARQVLPVVWTGFAILTASGLLLFAAEAAKSYTNPAFRFKLLLLVLAGLNPLVYYRTVYRRINQWDAHPKTPLAARIAGGASLTLWAAIIAAGRATAYFN
jgi:hypothetical protein